MGVPFSHSDVMIEKGMGPAAGRLAGRCFWQDPPDGGACRRADARSRRKKAIPFKRKANVRTAIFHPAAKIFCPGAKYAAKTQAAQNGPAQEAASSAKTERPRQIRQGSFIFLWAEVSHKERRIGNPAEIWRMSCHPAPRSGLSPFESGSPSHS